MIESKLGKIILMLITFGIVFWLVVPMFTGLSNKATEDACRFSVMARSAVALDLGIFGTIDKITPLACRTYHEERLQGSREEVKHQIGNLMSKCWYMYAEGRVDNIFDDHEDKRTVCNICYTFRIPEGMDLGGEPYIFEGDQFIDTQQDADLTRLPNAIHPPELIGFLLQTNYNPGVLYGGSTKTYIGGSWGWSSYEFRFADSLTTRYSRITRNPASPFIEDISGLITQDTVNEINNFGIKLYDGLGTNLFVVVAQEFNNIDRTAARRLTEQLNLNEEDRFNSILLMIDLENRIARLHMGVELESYILEGEIEGMLSDHFGRLSGPDSLNQAILNLINDLDDALFGSRSQVFQDLGITQRSYYNYLTNRLMAPPPQIISSITSDQTFAIGVASYKEENRVFWETVRESTYRTTALTFAGAGTGAAAGAAMGAIACWWTGFGAAACAGIGAIVGTILGGGTTYAVTTIVDLGTYDYNNTIIIAPLNALSGECVIYD